MRAVDARHVPMQMLNRDAVDKRRTLAALSPLIKGYLRCGAKVADGAVIDRQFGTTDIFIIMPVAELDLRYIEHFGGPAADKGGVSTEVIRWSDRPRRRTRLPRRHLVARLRPCRTVFVVGRLL